MDERTADEAVVEKAPRSSEADAIAAAARPERIGVGSGDENVAKLQLAARWAEQFGPASDDTLEAALARFKRAYHYVDSVTKLVEPDPA